MNRILFVIFLLSVVWHPSLLRSDIVVPWDRERLYAVPAMTETEDYSVEGFTSIFYEGISHRGEPTRVYAYYRAPEGSPPEGGWPAVVCLHGGGGTAFYQWVRRWNDHGYAAIAMDLEGYLPDVTRIQAERPSFKGAGPSKVGVFGDFAEPIEDQWFYQAVAQVVRAHSLIRSFPDVNPQKTGITGISWGGMLTTAVITVDHRFKFAVPVYGSGFLVGADGRMGNRLRDPQQQRIFNAFLGPEADFSSVAIPTLWINGNTDPFFPLPSFYQTAHATQGSTAFHIPLALSHSHEAGWSPQEIYAFADSVVQGQPALASLAPMEASGQVRTVSFDSESLITKAELLYTTDLGLRPDRKWTSTPAEVDGGRARAELPNAATAYYINVTDARGYLVSSSYHEVD